MERENNVFLTKEKLEEMRAKAQVMEDELHDLSAREFEKTGRLNSVKLSEKTQEYENYLLTIEALQKRDDPNKKQ